MRSVLVAIAVAGGFYSAATAAQVRYFLSTNGIINPANNESAAVAAALVQSSLNAGDPNVLPAGAHRLYLWSLIPATPLTDLKGFNLMFRTTGDVTIQSTDIWQNTNGSLIDDDGDPKTPPAFVENYRRWETGGWPGVQSWGSAQTADPTPTVSVLTDGVTNDVSAQDDHRRSVTFNGVPSRAIVVGNLDVTGTLGEIHIVNEASGFLQIDPNNRVFLGIDDTTGELAEITGQNYDNASPEATIGIPEPTNLALLSLAASLGFRRR